MTFELHIARDARERYGVDEALFRLTGTVAQQNLAACRRLALRMNQLGPPDDGPPRIVQAGELNAMGLIDEALHRLVAAYRNQVDPRAMSDALGALERRLGAERVAETLEAFVAAFPTADGYRASVPAATWLAGSTDGVGNREIALEELLLLWLANANPAFGPADELFDDEVLAGTAYERVIGGLGAWFGSERPFGPDGETLIELLRAPAIAAPDSLAGQLRFLRERWGTVLGDFLDRLIIGLDVMTEEEQALWQRLHPGTLGGPEAFGLAGNRFAAAGRAGDGEGDVEVERFSADREWMPRIVLIAKSTYVWLDQLSRQHGRQIGRLDEIPDEELDRLARLGFTGLWLIGLWQRSRASQTIKQLRGNPEAVASAYSLDEYRIADDLGGEEAYNRLRERAWARGIRIASDMVPNHMGIDSRWVMEHPDWFMTLPEPPYPAYTFNGPDLSPDDRVSIYLEDHYFDNSDAAVVFKRVDRATGAVTYLYHGNDGTSMPWNDTAQLDYLKPEVREAVIQTILGVARRSPVIRFDAAMTLARRHIERLWYPEPGHAGGIPSRAEHSMRKAEFEARMPVEFWREVVDRVAAEVPDTLLLAEAFWLMEGYFVRTLGMHRVYNSAFMNLLRDELNAEYRTVMKNTLEFDPEILKRYVNFMNNPDERTAVDQFGRGDKYFGIATLLATMPGLPMIGHGQIEGYTEKYGMEYRRAYRDEQPDPWLVERHEREIVPLLHRRAIFAEAAEFLLYDFETDDGSVNEDVYAYSNRSGGERSLIVYHNRYASAAGRIRESVTFAERLPGGEMVPRRRMLGDGLGLHVDDGWYLVLRDERSGLETIRASREVIEHGLRLELGAYDCRVFTGIRELQDSPQRPIGRLAAELGDRAVPSIEEAMRALLLRPVQEPLRRLLAGPRLARLRASVATPDDGTAGLLDAWLDDAAELARAARGHLDGAPVDDAVAHAARERLRGRVLALVGGSVAATGNSGAERGSGGTSGAAAGRASGDGDRWDPAAELATPATLTALLTWLALDEAPGLAGFESGPQVQGSAALGWLERFGLGNVLADEFRSAGMPEADAWRAVEGLRALLELPAWPIEEGTEPRPDTILEGWLANDAVVRFLQVNVHRDIRWFNREAFRQLAGWVALAELARVAPADAGADVRARSRRERPPSRDRAHAPPAGRGRRFLGLPRGRAAAVGAANCRPAYDRSGDRRGQTPGAEAAAEAMSWVQRDDTDARIAAGVHDGEGSIRISRFYHERMRLAVRIQLWELPAGTTEGAHIHPADDPTDNFEEFYYVLSGRGRMTMDDETLELGPGDALLAPTGVDHGLVSLGPDPLRILLIFGKPSAA